MSRSDNKNIELQSALQSKDLYKDDSEDQKQNNQEQIDDNELDKELSNADTNILNDIEQNENLTDSELFKRDFTNILLLIVLYMYQGFILAFFLEYVKNYLIQEKQIKGEQIALIRGIAWPFSIKFLWAPLMDTYYVKAFGKRKTYIVPSQIIMSILLFYSAFYFESWMENTDVLQISTIGVVCVFLLTVQDIAVDSWSVTLLHEKNVAYASFSQSFGQRIGNIFGYQLFIYLSDEQLMQSLFSYKEKVLTPFSMCIVMSVSILLGTLFIILFRKESNEEQNSSVYRQVEGNSSLINNNQQQSEGQEQEGFVNMLKNIVRFFKNKQILLLIFFLLSTSFGIYCVDITGEIILLEKGFNRSTLATIELCLIPLTQVISAYAARLSSKKLEFKIWIYCFVGKCFWNIGNYFLVNSFQKENMSYFIIPVAIMQVGDSILFTLPFIAISSFFLRVCDQSIGGTYITFLNSFSNLGRLWPSIVVTTLSTHLSFTALFIIGSIYNFILVLFWRKRVFNMQESDKKLWQIKQS
ncbi:hypothetical protein ABPG74_010431 [Tetrahymena malaccensis]